MQSVVDRVVARFADAFGASSVERQDVAWRLSSGDLAPFTRADRFASLNAVERVLLAWGLPADAGYLRTSSPLVNPETRELIMNGGVKVAKSLDEVRDWLEANRAFRREVLDRLVLATQLRFPIVGDLARSIRFRWFDQPLVDPDSKSAL